MKILFDLYKSADLYGKGSLDRAMDLADLLGYEYDSGQWGEPFTLFVPDTISLASTDLIKELIKDAGLFVVNTLSSSRYK